MRDMSAVSMPDIERRQYVTFYLNHEEYAVDALNVQEIVGFQDITRVPNIPEFIRGVINLRGSIIPVVDLKMRFGMHCEGYKKHTCIIVTEFSKGVMGIIVDAVTDVLLISEDSCLSAPAFGTKTKTDFIKGMGRIGSRLAIILNMERILTDEETSVITDVAGNKPDAVQ